MKNKLVQIRDLELIENELKNATAGVFAFVKDSDKAEQIVTPFLYLDKNIYILFESDDENYEKIAFNSNVSFTVYGDKNSQENNYKVFYIRCCGSVKKIEEQKTVDEISKSISEKYGLSFSETLKSVDEIDQNEIPDEDAKPTPRLILIDTEEIQAVEMSGE